EAMANAVPVVLPDHGSFPEMIADTGGGLLHRPLDPADLAEKIADLLRDSNRAAQLGRRGQIAIHGRYHAAAMAKRTLDLYRQTIQGRAWLVYCEERMLIDRGPYRSWREIQNKYSDYKASLGPCTEPEIVDFFTEDFKEEEHWPFTRTEIAEF